MEHRVAVAGSHDVSPLAAARIIKFLIRLGHPTVLLRRGRSTAPGTLEAEIADLCRLAGLPIEWHIPAPGGRDEVFFRDVDLVASADLLLAVFSPGRVMEGGTGHMVEKALDQRVPAYAFTFIPRGTDGTLAEDRLVWSRVGEYDPEDTWGAKMGLLS